MAKHIEIKIANESAEFTQIAQLNYATFVEEIPQHQTNPDRKLVDKFHAQNTYFIAKLENEIVGMLALRNQRPFSLDSKLSNLDDYMQPGESVCEIRLLAIQPTHRHSRVLRELFQALFKHCMSPRFQVLCRDSGHRRSALPTHVYDPQNGQSPTQGVAGWGVRK